VGIELLSIAFADPIHRPKHHRNPSDRLLVSQAIEQVELVKAAGPIGSTSIQP
jgi:PIN domain nuclease of toxin-antitoxin system